jgi:hypothetical protein
VHGEDVEVETATDDSGHPVGGYADERT